MTNPAALRKQFEDELKTLSVRLKAIGEGIHAPKSADWEEQAVDSENDEVLDALDTATREKILGLRAAIKRLEAGTYGICESCDGAISPVRLEAIAWTSHCVKCAD
jgi:RNA polymerase-binding transcription factor DksA